MTLVIDKIVIDKILTAKIVVMKQKVRFVVIVAIPSKEFQNFWYLLKSEPPPAQLK